MADWGLLGALGSGLQQGVASYQEEKERQRKQALDAALQKKQQLELAASLMTKGLKTDDQGNVSYRDDYLAQQRHKQELADAESAAKNAKEAAQTNLYNAQAKYWGSGGSSGKGGVNSGKTLPASSAEAVGGANSAFKQLDLLDDAFKANEDITGPFAGRASGLMGTFQIGDSGKKAAALKAATDQAVQSIGTYLEKGKLTDKDVPKYQNMIPQITDSPEVRLAKNESLKRLVAQRQQEEVASLGCIVTGKQIGRAHV